MDLWSKGTGLLRWGVDERGLWEYEPDAHASHVVGSHRIVPPLRRAWWWLTSWLWLPIVVLRVKKWPKAAQLSWEEYRPLSWADLREEHTPGADCRYKP